MKSAVAQRKQPVKQRGDMCAVDVWQSRVEKRGVIKWTLDGVEHEVHIKPTGEGRVCVTCRTADARLYLGGAGSC